MSAGDVREAGRRRQRERRRRAAEHTLAKLDTPMGHRDVGQCLRAARLALGVSQRSLMRMAGRLSHPGASPALVSSYERGLNDPGAGTIEDVATALGIRLAFAGGRWSWHPGGANE